MDVDDWTGFSRHFTHLKDGAEAKDRTLLLSAILGDAINLGLTKMAESSPGLTYAKLSWLQAWHIRDETYSAVCDVLIDAMQERGGNDILHGVPQILMMDPGSANTSAMARNLCRALRIRVIVHKPGAARVTGQVENARNLIERKFEAGLRFQPVADLDELNAAAKTWRAWFNAATYWTGLLGGEQPVLELPFDRPRPARQSHRGAQLGFELSRELVEAVRALAQREGASSFMLLLASFQALLYRYSGQADIRVGVPIANRNRVETERLIGFFVNTQVLKADLDASLCHRRNPGAAARRV